MLLSGAAAAAAAPHAADAAGAAAANMKLCKYEARAATLRGSLSWRRASLRHYFFCRQHTITVCTLPHHYLSEVEFTRLLYELVQAYRPKFIGY